MRSLLVLFALWAPMAFAENPLDRIHYGLSVRETNIELRAAEERGTCPGANLVVSCGDGKCEPSRGENQTNCAADCIPALVRSYNQQTLCRYVQRVVTPATVEEVQDAVRAAVAAGRHVRVVGRAHSANEQLCTAGDVVSTEKLSRVIGLENWRGIDTVVVEAGATIYDLAEWLHARGQSLGYSIIGFRGATVAGLAATGSHGSSPRHPAVLASRVEALWVVGADGELREYSARNTDETTWKALRANLGMLGAVARLRLKVEPQFNLRVRVRYEREKKLFAPAGAFALVKDCDFGLINWFPGTRKLMVSCGERTARKEQAGATNSLLDPGFPEFVVKPFKKVLQYGACHASMSCLLERVRYWLFQMAPPFKRNNVFGKLATAHDVTGPSHRMMSSVLTTQQRGLFQMDWEIAVPLSRAQAALEAVRDLARKQHVCLPLVGVFLRFALAEDATLLAHTVAIGDFKPGEPVMFIEMPVYLPTGFPPELQAAYDRPYEDFARLLIERFSGRAHWGKNREWVFDLERELGSFGPRLDQFRQVANQLDPTGVFANPFARHLGMEWRDDAAELFEPAKACVGKMAHPIASRGLSQF